MAGRPVAADGGDAGYVDHEAGLRWGFAFRVATVVTPDWWP